jgi:hypothetical protein
VVCCAVVWDSVSVYLYFFVVLYTFFPVAFERSLLRLLQFPDETSFDIFYHSASHSTCILVLTQRSFLHWDVAQSSAGGILGFRGFVFSRVVRPFHMKPLSYSFYPCCNAQVGHFAMKRPRNSSPPNGSLFLEIQCPFFWEVYDTDWFCMFIWCLGLLMITLGCFVWVLLCVCLSMVCVGSRCYTWETVVWSGFSVQIPVLIS